VNIYQPINQELLELQLPLITELSECVTLYAQSYQGHKYLFTDGVIRGILFARD
jgi:hypothetical protein